MRDNVETTGWSDTFKNRNVLVESKTAGQGGSGQTENRPGKDIRGPKKSKSTSRKGISSPSFSFLVIFCVLTWTRGNNLNSWNLHKLKSSENCFSLHAWSLCSHTYIKQFLNTFSSSYFLKWNEIIFIFLFPSTKAYSYRWWCCGSLGPRLVFSAVF